mgnify:CR=1 FL=1
MVISVVNRAPFEPNGSFTTCTMRNCPSCTKVRMSGFWSTSSFKISFELISEACKKAALSKPISIKAGTTSYTEFIYLSTTGYTSSTIGLKAFYIRPGSNNTQITLVSQTVNGAWVSGGFAEINSSNHPGYYRIDIPNAAFASGAKNVLISVRGGGVNGAYAYVEDNKKVKS